MDDFLSVPNFFFLMYTHLDQAGHNLYYEDRWSAPHLDNPPKKEIKKDPKKELDHELQLLLIRSGGRHVDYRTFDLSKEIETSLRINL